MAIGSLILEVIAFVISFIPLLGLISIFPCIASVVLAIVSLVKKFKNKGLSIAALILSGLSFITMIISTVIVGIYSFNLLTDNLSQIPKDEIISNIIEEIVPSENNTYNELNPNIYQNNNTLSNSIDHQMPNSNTNNSNTVSSNGYGNINGNGNYNSNYQTYSIGQTAVLDCLEVTCTNVDTNFQNYNQNSYIQPGYTVVKADFEFKNTGNSNFYVSFEDFDCYADYEDYDYFYSVTNATFATSIPSGSDYKASVYFQVPSNSNNIMLEYETNTWAEREIRFIVK